MSKGKAVVKFLRVLFAGLATLTGIVSFFLMVSVNDTYEHWWKLELGLLGVFILSMIVCAIAEDPNRLLRHLFAITFCVLAFAYRRLRIQNDDTYYCNKIRRKLDRYPQAYIFALDKYDEKLYKDFDEYDYEEC